MTQEHDPLDRKSKAMRAKEHLSKNLSERDFAFSELLARRKALLRATKIAQLSEARTGQESKDGEKME